MTEPKTGPSKGIAGLAASLPFLFVMVSCCLVPFVVHGEYDSAERMIAETGWAFWAILATAALGAVVCGVLVFLAGRGMRVPSAITLFFAALPWLVGIAGSMWGMSRVNEALVLADPSMKSALLAQGISEASNATVIGAWTAAGLLSAVAIGLALCAVGQRAPGRSGLGALVGVASALPMLGLAVWVLLAVGPSASVLVLVGLGAMVAGGVAAAGAGKDEPHRRSGALAGAAAVAIALAFVGTAVAVYTGAVIQGFGAIAVAGGSSALSIIPAFAAELAPARLATTWGSLATLLLVVGVGGWAALRSGASTGRVIGAVALVIVAALFPLSQSAVSAYTSNSIAAVGARPWDDVAGLEPAHIETADSCWVRAIVQTSGVSIPGEPPAPFSDPAAIERVLQRAVSPQPSDEYVFAPPDEHTPRLGLTVDGRLGSEQLSFVVERARAAGARSLCVAGPRGASMMSPAEREVVERNTPILAAIVSGGEGAVRIDFPDEAAAAQDPVLHHATVGSEASVTTSTRAGSAAAGVTLSPAEEVVPYGSLETGDVYLALGPDATAATYFGVAAAAARRGFTPVMVSGEIPGNPTEPLAGAEAGLLGLLGTGAIGGLGAGGGQPEVLGSLSRDAIQEVIRTHQSEVRFCYERELVRNPTLSGTVTVSITIGPDGSVTRASAEGPDVPAALTDCVAERARSWQFPAPSGGGIVRVNYPFAFRPS